MTEKPSVIKQKRKDLISWTIFLATLGVTLISLTTVIFPALILRTFGGFEDYLGVNSFEVGIWSYHVLVVNAIILILFILYKKNTLPKLITKSVKWINSFEISTSVAFLIITILVGLYIIFTIPEIFDESYQADYYERVKSWLENYSVYSLDTGVGRHVALFLIFESMQIFGNYKVIPFLASIALLITTYLVTSEISKNRFAGIVAMVIVLQSGIFLMYDTSVAYPNFWILFYLLALYLIYKTWSISPIAYVLSVFSKELVVPLFPMLLFFIYRSKLTKQKKIRIFLLYAIIAIPGILFYINMGGVGIIEFNEHDFWSGFTAFSSSFRFDGLVIIFLLPLVIGLFIVAKKKSIAHADSMMFLIMAMLLAAPLMQGFSNVINVPYRFLPLVVFFAIGVGTLLTKKVN